MTFGVFKNRLGKMSHTGFLSHPSTSEIRCLFMNYSHVGMPSLHLTLDEFESYNLEKKSSICLALNLKGALK